MSRIVLVDVLNNFHDITFALFFDFDLNLGGKKNPIVKMQNLGSRVVFSNILNNFKQKILKFFSKNFLEELFRGGIYFLPIIV